MGFMKIPVSSANKQNTIRIKKMFKERASHPIVFKRSYIKPINAEALVSGAGVRVSIALV
ncbi:MAG: hypothetical protein LBQ77_02425 [Treponema sp.]|nr:hypothetical protein [Treponema sp.]